MPFLFTPGQLARRAELYHQLNALTAAGIGLIQTLEQLQRHPPAASFRAPLRRVIDEINSGLTFTEAVVRSGNWTVTFDTALLEAGERSGRLDQCFKLLADYYEQRARVARQLVSDMAYPVFVLHFAVFILPFAEFFSSGDWRTYLLKTLGVLLPLYAVILLGMFVAQGRHGEVWRGVLELLLRPLPLLGSGRQTLALARLAAALEALLGAGVGMIEAWELAARASGSPAMARAVARWKPGLTAGRTPAELAATTRCIPELFATQYASGELSGKLEETLRRLHRYFQEEGTRKVQAFAQWSPRLFYLLVAAMVAWKVISFHLGYFEKIREAGGF